METTENPPVMNSFHCTGELSTGTVELTKKRKLQFEFGTSRVSCPKYRFHDRPSAVQEYLNTNISEIEGNSFNKLSGRKIGDRFEKLEEMDKDSGKSTGVYDSTIILPGQGTTEYSSLQTSHQGWPSLASSNSSSNNNFKDTLYSLESRSIKEIHSMEPAGLEGCQQDQLMHNDVDCSCLGAYGDYNLSEFGNDGIEFSDATIQEMMLYSNDVAPNALLLPPGRGSAGQDALLGSRKPTIDQEFEQYFSMLML